jgi:YegS/Rv2252/BmrU family lipid kinase
MKTLFIVNPNAGNGRGRRTWTQIQPYLAKWADDYNVTMTEYPDDVIDCVGKAAEEGVQRVIAIGGDGTNNILINALMTHNRLNPESAMLFGSIPAGTGRDFARSLNLPLDTIKATHYLLTKAVHQAVDVGLVEYAGQRRYFLNISSSGITRDAVARVERAPKRPWTYLVASITSLLRYKPEAVKIELDGHRWYEGKVYISAVANGRFFGQGIMIAPNAKIDDGYFDVVIAEEMPTFDLMRAFPTLYTGKHIFNPKVRVAHARHVRVISKSGNPMGMDLDGEPAAGGYEITYTIVPGALNMLI